MHRLYDGIHPDYQMAMMNMSASHDSPRLSTSFYNKGKYKFGANPDGNPEYKIDKPDAETLTRQKLFLIHQFTFVGGPQIWNGDEVGMWGADDPHCRKPIVWDDLTYTNEVAHYDRTRQFTPTHIQPDKALHAFYKQLIALRKANPVLATGGLQWVGDANQPALLAYHRYNEQKQVVTVMMNLATEAKQFTLPLPYGCTQLTDQLTGTAYNCTGTGVTVSLPALSAVVLKP